MERWDKKNLREEIAYPSPTPKSDTDTYHRPHHPHLLAATGDWGK